MDRDSFVMHRNFLDGIPEEEQFKWLKIITEYAFNGVVPEFSNWLENKIFTNIQNRIEADREAYEIKKERNRQRQAEWRKKNGVTVTNVSNTCHTLSQSESVTLDTDTPSVSVSDSVSDSEFVFDSEFKSDSVSDSEFKREGNKSSPAREKKSSRIPTDEEVRAYMYEKGYTFNVDKLLNHYQANGWTQSSGAPIKDWKAAVRQWNIREKEFAPKTEVVETPSHVDYNSDEWKQEDW